MPGWPPELGGRNLPPVQQLVYHEEMAKIPVERSNNPQGLGIIAPSILDYGSDFLKQKYLLPTLRAEIAWCLGMSEPGAGSDLAASSTRAEVHDDHFVVSGQKIWTSGAHHADHCFCFVRTDPDAPKHRGISVADHRHEGAGRHARARCPISSTAIASTSTRSSSTAWWCRATTWSARSTRAGRSRRARWRTSAA